MDYLTETVRFIFHLLAALIAIDFTSGLIHWTEDTFWTENTPIVGKWIVQPNLLHHEQPSAFTRKSWWASSWDLVLASALIAGVAYLLDSLTWEVILFCLIGANANQLHKYGHLSPEMTPLPIRLLQKSGILQSPRHHAPHHSGGKNTAYCVVTPFLNPILDKTGFWRLLEMLTVPIFGAPRRTDLNKESPGC